MLCPPFAWPYCFNIGDGLGFQVAGLGSLGRLRLAQTSEVPRMLAHAALALGSRLRSSDYFGSLGSATKQACSRPGLRPALWKTSHCWVISTAGKLAQRAI